MITTQDYFGPRWHPRHPEITDDHIAAATDLLDKVNALLERARSGGAYVDPINPYTRTRVSGSRGGSGDGGWRPSGATTGVAKSKHKLAHAVDVYDPSNTLDNWLTDPILKEFGLFREHPAHTQTWCHLQDVPPGSWSEENEIRTYYP